MSRQNALSIYLDNNTKDQLVGKLWDAGRACANRSHVKTKKEDF